MTSSMTPPRYGNLNHEALWAEYPPAPEFIGGVDRLSRDELRALQEPRFLAQVERAWQIPFYQSFWARHGLEAGDIKSLDDLTKIPVFSVHDMRESVTQSAPWGDLSGIDPERDDPVPLLLQTSGGTTGLPRAMLYTPRDREVMNIVTGRRMYMQGVRPFDLVQVALATGLQNAGILLRESLYGYCGAVPIMTGTGNQTPTRRQIEILRAWKVQWFAAGGSYLRHVATVAREEFGFDVRELKLKGLLSWLGAEPREGIEELWGTQVYDNYGANEFGTIAADCGARAGLHIFEDAFVWELLNPDSMESVADGEKGALVLTTLFKYAAPMIRYNTNDMFRHIPGVCPCGSTHRRLTGMLGRADNMIKFRGISVFPDAIGGFVADDDRTTGEFICVLDPPDANGRENMKVLVEAADATIDRAALRERLTSRLKDGVGVNLDLEIVAAGELRAMTLLDTQTKPRRLIDKSKEA